MSVNGIPDFAHMRDGDILQYIADHADVTTPAAARLTRDLTARAIAVLRARLYALAAEKRARESGGGPPSLQ